MFSSIIVVKCQWCHIDENKLYPFLVSLSLSMEGITSILYACIDFAFLLSIVNQPEFHFYLPLGITSI